MMRRPSPTTRGSCVRSAVSKPRLAHLIYIRRPCARTSRPRALRAHPPCACAYVHVHVHVHVSVPVPVPVPVIKIMLLAVLRCGAGLPRPRCPHPAEPRPAAPPRVCAAARRRHVGTPLQRALLQLWRARAASLAVHPGLAAPRGALRQLAVEGPRAALPGGPAEPYRRCGGRHHTRQGREHNRPIQGQA